MIRHGLIFAFLSVVVGAGVMTARGYYCRDPDTGKLYPLNASWPSSSFCGSYTCKIRKRNVTESKYMPWRQMNFTKDFKQNITTILKANKGNPDDKPTTNYRPCNRITPVGYNSPVYDDVTADNRIDGEIENITKGEILDIIHKKIENTTVNIMNKLKLNYSSNKDENDRYLTEDEIKNLIDILHSIKKSDLVAFVEMYNLAQNVYNELDATENGNLIETVDEHNNHSNKVNADIKEIEPASTKTSYWYEPLAVPVNKQKGDLDTVKDNILQSFEEISTSITNEDILIDNSYIDSTTIPPNPKSIKTDMDTNMYLGASLVNEDFRMLPYFYPMSAFQRLSSYVNPNVQITPNMKAANVVQTQVQMQHLFQTNLLRSLLINDLESSVQQTVQTSTQSTNQNTENALSQDSISNLTPQTKILTSLFPAISTQNNLLPLHDSDITLLTGYKPHCNHEASNLQYLHAHPSWFNRIVKKPFLIENKNHDLDPVPINIPKEKTIAHLPYPLNYLDSMNTSNQITKNSEPWAVSDFVESKLQPAYVNADYIAHLPNTLVINPVSEETQDLPQNIRLKKMAGDKDYEIPTKRNLLDSLKSVNPQKIPLKRKLKLQKGTALKLDTLLRKRRDAVETKKGETGSNASLDKVEEFEVYLDRSMCDADTTPGFFRIGNLTEPFPACCPQRIGSNR